jgi:hypothetical protein
MKKRVTLNRPGHTTVVAYLSLFLVVGGGAAYAASHLSKNSVTSQTIKNGQVKTADLAAGAVTNPKLANGAVSSTTVLDNSLGTNDLADGSVTAAKLAAGAVSPASIPPNSLTGADINESTLVGTKAGNVYSLMFDTSKGCCETQIARASDPGIKSDGCGGAPACGVIFPRDVSNCSYTASSTNASDTGLSATPAYAETALLPSAHTEVNVEMFDKTGAAVLHDFALIVVCP